MATVFRKGDGAERSQQGEGNGGTHNEPPTVTFNVRQAGNAFRTAAAEHVAHGA